LLLVIRHQFVHLPARLQVATQFYLLQVQHLVTGLFQQVLQPLIFWLLAVAVVVVQMVDQAAAAARFNTQPVIR
jgi:uncharacterized membrane protein